MAQWLLWSLWGKKKKSSHLCPRLPTQPGCWYLSEITSSPSTLIAWPSLRKFPPFLPRTLALSSSWNILLPESHTACYSHLCSNTAVLEQPSSPMPTRTTNCTHHALFHAGFPPSSLSLISLTWIGYVYFLYPFLEWTYVAKYPFRKAASIYTPAVYAC